MDGAIKLQPETVAVIDRMFEIMANSEQEHMDEHEFTAWTEKFVKARMDWQGYKTFLDV
jgi:hypothetical protein